MNLALILHYFTTLYSNFPEIVQLWNRIKEELDKVPGETRMLNVMGRTAQFDPEFIKEIQEDHSVAIVALEQSFDCDGEVFMQSRAFGSGAFLKILPWLVENRELVEQLIELFMKFNNGTLQVNDVTRTLVDSIDNDEKEFRANGSN